MQTRWYHYVLAFIAAGIVVNCLPHFINGISGRPFPTPFADPPGAGLSSAPINIIWATINGVVAWGFVHFGKLRPRHRTVLPAYLIGALAMAFYLAWYFGALNPA